MTLIPIPHSLSYTATAAGTVVRRVRCEKCDGEYGYRMLCETKGSGTSVLFLDNAGAKARAGDRAVANLSQALETAEEAVPCPACGWYQQRMVPLLRRRYGRTARRIGYGLLWAVPVVFVAILLVYGFTSDHVPWGLAVGLSAGVGLAGGCVLFVRARKAAGHDPNEGDPEERRSLGQSLAVAPEEMDEGKSVLAAPAASSPPPAQVVGSACGVCGRRIVFAKDGWACRACGKVVHSACATGPSGPNAATRCAECGSLAADGPPPPGD